ncbi:MAG: radical SAM protein [Verrucomicrobiae bacterium]|nr:radical SAM protein [Verrucomicrobiae bacterium]
MSLSYRRILLIYPAFNKTHWGMDYALPMIGKRSIIAPLGLLTIAALTPSEYDIRLVDLNGQPFDEEDVRWADMVCFSAMIAQKRSLFELADRCRAMGKLVVFGGPFPTTCPDECAPHCDVMVLNEGEMTWRPFLDDLSKGIHKSVYSSGEKADVSTTPAPRFDLVRTQDYLNIPVQFARGCPFECEFCDIPVMLGRKPRTKTPRQILAELDAIFQTGYRGGIMVVDDNFIGKKVEAKALLAEIKTWNKAHQTPFYYSTQVTVTLAEDEELLRLMKEANFTGVFVGVETPSLESLKETRKYQNTRHSLLEAVRTIQTSGLFVFAGFIVGFDHDGNDIFDRQIEFIRQAAIPAPTFSLLFALPGTPLRERMRKAGRLRLLEDEGGVSWSFTAFDTNIETELPRRKLLEGYRRLISTVYEPAAYFSRSLEFFRRMPPPESPSTRMQGFLRVGWLVCEMISSGGRSGGTVPAGSSSGELIRDAFRHLSAEYKWELVKFLWNILWQCPAQFMSAMIFSFAGIHYHRFSFEDLIPDVERKLRLLPEDPAEKCV